MNRSIVMSIRQPLGLAVAFSIATLFLSGCAHMGGAPTAEAVAAPVDPSSYSWQGTSIEAVGRGSAPASTSAPQRPLVARNAARVAAIKDLKAQVRNLPAGPNGTLGSIMDNYLAVRRAVENQLQSAEMLDERSISSSETEVRVRLPLAPIADILRQNYITPNEELPRPPSSGTEGVPPVT